MSLDSSPIAPPDVPMTELVEGIPPSLVDIRGGLFPESLSVAHRIADLGREALVGYGGYDTTPPPNNGAGALISGINDRGSHLVA